MRLIVVVILVQGQSATATTGLVARHICPNLLLIDGSKYSIPIHPFLSTSSRINSHQDVDLSIYRDKVDAEQNIWNR